MIPRVKRVQHKAFLLLLFCFLSRGSLFAGSFIPVVSEDFETEKEDGLYQKAVSNSNLSVIAGEGVGGGTALRVTYVGYDRGSERIVVHYPLPQPLLEATLNFDVQFESDFQFVRGGKLNGLAPSNKITGGNAIEPDGWSTRCMWRSEGTFDTYTYHQDQSGTYGEGSEDLASFVFEKEVYYAMSYHVRVNDPPTSSNGFFHVYVNGEMVRRHDDLRLRAEGDENSMIYQMLISTFHGGSSDDWAPKNPDGSYANVHALFDNFTVYEGLNIRETPGIGQTIPVLQLPHPSQPRLCFQCPGLGGAFTVDGRWSSSETHRMLLLKP